MTRTLIAASIAAIAALTPVGTAHADTATTPTLVAGANPYLYREDVASTVTVDQPADITLTTTAYRHPVTVRAKITATEAGTYRIVAPCRYTRLPMDWAVNVNGVRLAGATLRCA